VTVHDICLDLGRTSRNVRARNDIAHSELPAHGDPTEPEREARGQQREAGLGL
jgi:hypothetical protein